MPCRKQEGFVGNDKVLSETRKVCRKRQFVVTYDKAFFGRVAASSGDTSAACRHVFYPVSELAIFRQSACRKRQIFVGMFILSREKPP